MSRGPSRPSTPAPMGKPTKSGSASSGAAAKKLGPQPAPQRLAPPKSAKPTALGPQPAPKRLTPSGGTAGGSKPATLTSAGKTGPVAGKPVTASAQGGAKQAFKQAGPSNPMGRTGGKPGVNIGTSKF